MWFKQCDNEIIQKFELFKLYYSGFSEILFFELVQSLVCLVCLKAHIYMVLPCYLAILAEVLPLPTYPLGAVWFRCCYGNDMGLLAGGNGCKGTEYATCLVGSRSASLLRIR